MRFWVDRNLDSDGGRESRPLEADAFPLPLGGDDSELELPGWSSTDPVGHIGLSGGDLFVQPASDQVALACNGTRLSTSHWLHDGDLLSIGRVRIQVRRRGDETRFRIEVQEEETTDPPEVEPVSEAVSPEPRKTGGATIKPIAFEPTPLRPAGRGRSLGLPSLLVWVALLLLGLVGWLVFDSRSVVIETDPPAESLRLQGTVWAWQLGGRYLLRPGRHMVVAEKSGYRRLEEPIEVTADRSQEFRLVFEPLPGRLAVSTLPAEGVTVTLDGEEAGSTPIEPIELSAGTHQLQLRAEGYRDVEAEVVIEGAGSMTDFHAELEPDWGVVRFLSEPSGAAVTVDGRSLGETPLTTKVTEGSHAFELALPGRKVQRGRMVVRAGVSQELGPVALPLVDATLQVRSSPTEASVRVDGVYRGETPLELALAPGEHAIDVSQAGFDPASRRVSLTAGQNERVTLALTAQLGELEILADPPDAELLVNGESRGAARQVLRLPAVPQQILIQKEGYESFGTSVTPRPNFPQTIEVALESTADLKKAARPGTIRTSQGQELVLIEPRPIRMGASRREPGRRANETLRDVELTRAYYLSTTEVSNRQFREFKSDHRSGMAREHNLDGEGFPVVRVSWQDAAGYCNWLSAKESLPPAYAARNGTLIAVAPPTLGYRLPTEAEWARAARYADGDSPSKYPWGDSLPVTAGAGNFADRSARGLVPAVLPNYDDSFPVTAPVDSFEPNGLGIYNLGGNVAEWMQDYYQIYPASRGRSVDRDPLGPETGEFRVIRGASWMHGTIGQLRLSYRDYGKDARPDLGFRIARYLE